MPDLLASFSIECDNPFLEAGVLVATIPAIQSSPPELLAEIEACSANLVRQKESPADRLRTDIRLLLRQGGYKPAGRGRPSSEYLSNSARNGKFPRINHVVDITNLVSLESGLPGSLLDLEKTGPNLVIRYGNENEAYVFNQSGQEISLPGLMCLCNAEPRGIGQPYGNPVKDSMVAKTTEKTTSIIGVLFSNFEVVPTERLIGFMDRYKTLLEQYAAATEVSYRCFRSQN